MAPPGEVRRRVRVALREGLHARPCAAIAKAVQKARGTGLVLVGVRGRADAGQIIELMTLCIGRGEEVELIATGPRAEALLETVAGVLTAPGEE